MKRAYRKELTRQGINVLEAKEACGRMLFNHMNYGKYDLIKKEIASMRLREAKDEFPYLGVLYAEYIKGIHMDLKGNKLKLHVFKDFINDIIFAEGYMINSNGDEIPLDITTNLSQEDLNDGDFHPDEWGGSTYRHIYTGVSNG